MSKDPLGGALSKSLRDEGTAVDQRFARADSVLGGQGRELSARHAKPTPPKKERAIRDTFSFSEADYALLPELQQRCLQGQHSASKSEIVRAGLKALAQMKPKELLAAVAAVEKLKPGPGKRAA